MPKRGTGIGSSDLFRLRSFYWSNSERRGSASCLDSYVYFTSKPCVGIDEWVEIEYIPRLEYYRIRRSHKTWEDMTEKEKAGIDYRLKAMVEGSTRPWKE